MDSFASDRSRHGMTEVNLAFPLAFAKPSIQKPGGVDQERLLSKAASIEIGGRVDGVVGVSLKSHGGTEEW